MSDLIFYGLNSCDTCRKARKALAEAGRSVTYIDVREDGIPPDLLADWIDRVGIDALVNKRSTTWRGLEESDQRKALTAEGAVMVLGLHPTLLKRPVIVEDGTLHIGWGPAVQDDLLV